MNSKNKVTEIREQRQEKWRDSKREIKMEGWGVREVYGSRRDEAIKEKDEMVLFHFPFWEFLSLCEAARSLSRNCGLWLSLCFRGCAQGEKKTGREKRKGKRLWKCQMQKCLRVISSLCLSENSLNYESTAAQSRLMSQANLNQTKPGLDLLRSTCFVL